MNGLFISFVYNISSNQKNIKLLVNNNIYTPTDFINSNFVIDDVTGTVSNFFIPLIGRYHYYNPNTIPNLIDYYYGYLDNFKFYSKDLSYSQLQEEYNFRISFNNESILQHIKVSYLENSLTSHDNEIFVCDNYNLATNDIILIDTEQIKILNIHNNNLVVKRGYNNTYSQPHNEGSIIILLDKPLEYSDIIHKKHFINSNNDISNNLSNNEIKENIEEQPKHY